MVNFLSETFFIAFFSVSSLASSESICNVYCDERDPALASGTIREPVQLILNSRRVVLRVSDQDNMAYGMITNGEPGDEVHIILVIPMENILSEFYINLTETEIRQSCYKALNFPKRHILHLVIDWHILIKTFVAVTQYLCA